MGQVFDLTDPRTVNLWDQKAEMEVRGYSALLDPDNGLMGAPDSGALVVTKDEMSSGGKGALVRMKMIYQLEQRGRQGAEVAKGHGEGYKDATFDVYANRLRFVYTSEDPMAQQAVPEDVLDTGSALLGDLMARRQALALHLHATGISTITDNAYRLHNTINAVNSEYILRPNGKSANNLTSSDTFDVNLLNDANRLVSLIRPRIRPASTPWGPKFCLFLAPEQIHSLRESDSQWYAAMTAKIQGGDGESGIFSRALGVWLDFVIFSDLFVPPGVDSDSSPTVGLSDTRRAWVGGANALALAHAKGYRNDPAYAANRYRWDFESEDFGSQMDIALTTNVGVARPRFTRPGEASAREAGVVVIETFASKGGLSDATVYDEWIDAGLTIS